MAQWVLISISSTVAALASHHATLIHHGSQDWAGWIKSKHIHNRCKYIDFSTLRSTPEPKSIPLLQILYDTILLCFALSLSNLRIVRIFRRNQIVEFFKHMQLSYICLPFWRNLTKTWWPSALAVLVLFASKKLPRKRGSSQEMKLLKTQAELECKEKVPKRCRSIPSKGLWISLKFSDISTQKHKSPISKNVQSQSLRAQVEPPAPSSSDTEERGQLYWLKVDAKMLNGTGWKWCGSVSLDLH